MAKGAKLKDALDRQKGIDHRLEKQKRMQKKALKRKRARTEEADSENEEEEQDETELEFHTPKASKDEKTPKSKRQKKLLLAAAKDSEGEAASPEGSEDWETADEEAPVFDLARLQDSDTSDSDDDEEYDRAPLPEVKIVNGKIVNGDAKQDPEDEDDEDEEDIPLSDIESLASEDKEDVVPHQRLTINNTAALTRAYKSIALPSSLPFSATQAITSAEPTTIADIDDDLNRELAFYKQSLGAVTQARALLKKEGVPFSRPVDYFAEMVKSDEHMGKIKKKLVDDAASKKAAAEARRQRDLKKFGKQVQVAKLQERDKAKRETMDKIKMLKKKRSGASIGNAQEEDMFDVALEDAAETEKKDKAARRASGAGPTNGKRQRKDDKYGYGGKKRFAKSNDAQSSADTRSFSVKKMKGKTGAKQRPGKARRAARS